MSKSRELAERIAREAFHIECAGAIDHNRLLSASFDKERAAALIDSALPKSDDSAIPIEFVLKREKQMFDAGFQAGKDWVALLVWPRLFKFREWFIDDTRELLKDGLLHLNDLDRLEEKLAELESVVPAAPCTDSEEK